MKSKTFTVDWDAPQDLRRLASQLRYRARLIGNDKEMNSSSKDEVFRSCLSILGTDISSLYQGKDEQKLYYVYAHLDTSTRIRLNSNGMHRFMAELNMEYVPFYIGKGTGDRAEDASRNETHRKVSQKLKALGKQMIILRIRENLTEAEAFQLEAKLIDIFGLLPNGGFLTNLDEGHRKFERRRMYKDALLTVHRKTWRQIIKELREE